MLIGIPKEIKNHEYRVAATPAIVKTLVDAGHRVYIEKDAGTAIGYTDQDFKDAGGEIVPTPEAVYEAEMIVKVKEPLESEFPLMREGQILFCFLHLAAEPVLTKELVNRGVVAIAYETVVNAVGALPLLVPMSEIAGRISIQSGAVSLQLNNGGRGLLLGGVPGVTPADVLIIGGGIVGVEAARMALGLGASVTIMDNNLVRLRQLDELYGPRLQTLYSTQSSIEDRLPYADLVIGSVLIPGKKAPKLITRTMVKTMRPGSVIVDVAIDQGGCAETSRPTTHAEPTFVEEGVLHYCVTNMPGACARTATQALTNATTNYTLEIANKGYRQALMENAGLLEGLNVYRGHVTNHAVAHDLGYTYASPADVL